MVSNAIQQYEIVRAATKQARPPHAGQSIFPRQKAFHNLPSAIAFATEFKAYTTWTEGSLGVSLGLGLGLRGVRRDRVWGYRRGLRGEG